jgi:glycerophosphoryl diester phosphodiesterase
VGYLLPDCLLLVAMSVVVLRKLIAWSLALPLVLFLDVPPTRSFRESKRLTRGERRQILQVLVLWALAALVLGVLTLGLVQALGDWIVPLFFDSLPILVIVLGGLVAVWFLAKLLATAFNSGSFALLIVALSWQIRSTR